MVIVITISGQVVRWNLRLQNFIQH